MEMTLNEYQERAMATCMPTCDNTMYMLLGLTEDVGELNGKFSKAIRKGRIAINGNEISSSMKSDDFAAWMEDVVKECGDILWMLSGLLHTFGLPLQFVAEENLAKLAARKANGTIDGSGDGVTKEERL